MPDSSQQGPDLAPGQKLGNYTIVRKVGEGGMGAVYEAHQAGINRRVALKVLPKALMQNRVFLERFLREAQSAGALNHPNIVTVYEVVQDQGHYFFSMEYVDGHTLREQLKRTGRMSADEALKIARKVAQALHYAWTEARIIHRDIKPDNIMLTRQGEVKVADLGLAKSTARDTTVTADGTGIGTPAYMSPEQSRAAKDIDCRADIYSLGITLFQMVTARLPFEAETPYAVVLAHAEQPLPDPKAICPEIPDSVSALIQRMCAKDPSQRYETPGQLVDEIDAIARPGAAGPTGPIPTDAFRQQPTIPISQRRRRLPNSRSRAPVILGVVAGLAVVGGLGHMMLRNGSPGGPSSTTTTTRTTIKGGGNGDLLARAQGMFDYAMEYAQKHPSDFKEVINKFEEVRINAAGTVYAMRAADQILEWRKTWDGAGSAEIEKRKALVAKCLADAGFAEARAVWQDFPKDLLTDATRERVNAEIAKVEAAVRAFAQDLRRQAAPFLANEPGQLTGNDIATLAALKAKAEQPPGGLDAAGKAALAALAGRIGQALAAYQEHLAAEQAKVFEAFWQEYEKLIKGKSFDEAVALCEKAKNAFVVPPLGGPEEGPPKGGTTNATNATNEWTAKLRMLAGDALLLKGLFAGVIKNLPHLKGKTIRVGGMAMTVSDVKDGKVYVKQDATEMAFGMDKLDDETTLMLALLGEKDPGLLVRKKALFAFYYGRETEVVAKLKEARESGADVSFYLSRLRPVLVVTSVPPGSSVAVEVKKGGAWQKAPGDVQKTPARCEVPGHGSYRVKVSKDGYLTATREITVREVGELKLVFSLKKAGLWPPVRDGLVLHYSFDKAGERADDLSGKGNHGTLHGVKWTADGKVGGAYEFDGKNAYVETPHSKSFDFEPNEFTIAVWICPPAWIGSDGMNAIVTKGGDGGHWLLRVAKRHETGNVAKLNSESVVGRRFANSEVTLNQWHHVAMKKGRNRLTFYLDGKEDGAFDHGPVLDTTGQLRISGQWNVGNQRFTGLIDEFMVFDRALSETEIRSLAEPEQVIGEAPPAAGYDADALLAAGLEIPKEAKDKYGNPIRKGADAATDLPLEIRHKKTGMHLVFIPAGEFMMGSPGTERDREADNREGPLHRARITEPYYLGKYEVTQTEWQTVMRANPSTFKGGRNPVETVSWRDCQSFTKEMNEGLRHPQGGGRGEGACHFSLPSEAQREYACRAGTSPRFYYGDDPPYEELGRYAWFNGNSGGRAHAVGEKKPNLWGLHDMHGNVWEWCEDWHGAYPAGTVTDPAGPERGADRVARGGDWGHSAGHCRAAYRGWDRPDSRNGTIGFRVALAIPVGGLQGPPIRDGLALYYPFDEAGDRAEDKSGKGNHGKVHGATWSANGKVNGAYRFDGRDDYTETPQSDDLHFRAEDFTIATWIYPTAWRPGYSSIVTEHDADDGSWLFRAEKSRRTGDVAKLLFATDRPNRSDFANSEVTINQWHHVAVARARANYTFYLDGRKDGAFHNDEALTTRTSLRISGQGNVADERFTGLIDEFMIFRRCLPADEVKALFEWKPRLGALAAPR